MTPLRVTLFGVVAFFALRLLAAGRLELSGEEALLWALAQDGAAELSPALALLVRAGDAALGLLGQGPQEIGVRGPLLLMTAAVVLGALPQHPRPGQAALLLLAPPMVGLWGTFLSVEALLGCAWLAVVVAAERRAWPAVGLGLALAVLGGLEGLLLAAAVVVGVEDRPRGLLAAVGLGVGAGALGWLAWAGGVPPLQEGVGQASGFGVLLPVLWVISEGLEMGPVVMAAVLIWLVLERRRRGLLWWATVLPHGATLALAVLAFSFGSAALDGLLQSLASAQGAWLPALWGLARVGGRLDRLALVGGLLAAVNTLMMLGVAAGASVDAAEDPFAEHRAGPELAQSVEAWGREPVLCKAPEVAGWIRFYGGLEAGTLPGDGMALALPRAALPEEAIFVKGGKDSGPSPPLDLYEEAVEVNIVQLQHRGRPTEPYYITPLRGLKAP